MIHPLVLLALINYTPKIYISTLMFGMVIVIVLLKVELKIIAHI